MNIRSIIILIAAAFLLASCSNDTVVGPNTTNPSPQASTMDAKYAADWSFVLYNAVADQDINPPKASRIYAYSFVTMYESVVNGMPSYRSISGQVNEMPAMPSAGQTIYDWPSVIAGSMPVVIRAVMDTVFPITSTAITNLANSQIAERRTLVDTAVVSRSITYGQSIAAAIIAWKNNDQYIQTRTMVYTVPSRNGHRFYWEPTDPAHLNPLEPFWGLLRPFAMATGSSCEIQQNIAQDSTAGSDFYNMAMEVKTTVENLTLEQQDITLYWQDKLRTGTPAGHWLSIMTQMVGKFNMKLDKAVEMYALGTIAMADAFISCWASKYKFNLLRPLTYIKDYIHDPNWEPFLVTPPFPEFTSGHSTQSSSVAYVLTTLLGDNVAFTDTTVRSVGLNPRSFTSFNAARDEAVISRLYGGIHYREGNERGRDQGTLVGQTTMNKVKLKIY